jgi:hypothetical protein
MGKWKELAEPDDIHSCHAECQNPACIAVRQAVAEEREQCALLCDQHTNPKEDEPVTQFQSGGYITAEFLAAMIRARGQG